MIVQRPARLSVDKTDAGGQTSQCWHRLAHAPLSGHLSRGQSNTAGSCGRADSRQTYTTAGYNGGAVENRDTAKEEGFRRTSFAFRCRNLCRIQVFSNTCEAKNSDLPQNSQTSATGLEPATTGSTVRYSIQLSYAPEFSERSNVFSRRRLSSNSADGFRLQFYARFYC